MTVKIVTDAPYWRWLLTNNHSKMFDDPYNKHFQLFTLGHLCNLFEFVGFQITNIQPFNHVRKKLDILFSYLPHIRNVSYTRILIEALN